MKDFWPNFFIVGAARSGTTSLHEYLRNVKGIYMSPVKEPHFFVEEVGPLYRHVPHFKDPARYLSLFQPKNGEFILGESSCSYLYDDTAPSSIYAKIPDARIVILLRDPIERAYSHFLHHLRYGFDNTFNFLEAIKNDYYSKGRKGWGFTRLYVELGMYSQQVQRYFDVFGRDKVKVVIYEDEFKSITNETVNDVIRFLGLNESVSEEITQKIFNTSLDSFSGSFVVPRVRAIPLIQGKYSPNTRMVSDIRRNNSLLMTLTYPITSALWKNFLFKNKEQPALTESASTFLLRIYREDVHELSKILRRTPSWSIKYQNN
jgi:hypothetical protein